MNQTFTSRRLLLSAAMMLGVATQSVAQVFYDSDNDIKYQIISSADMTCKVSSNMNRKTLTDVVIPEQANNKGTYYTVVEMADQAFDGCTALKSVSLPATIQTVGSNVFRSDKALESVTLPEGFTVMGSSMFSGCTGLTEITLPSTLTTIGDMAFDGCTGLTSVTLPASVTSMGMMVFNGCQGHLEAVYSLNPTPTDVDGLAFYPSTFYSSTPLYVPMGSLDLYKSAKGWKLFKTIEEKELTPTAIEAKTLSSGNASGAWYTLSGQLIGSRPARAGIYVHEGKKVVLR